MIWLHYAPKCLQHSNLPTWPSIFTDWPHSNIWQPNSILWAWMFSNGLRLDTDKTQLVWLGTRHLLFEVDYASLISPFPNLTFSNCVKNLGFCINSNLTFKDHFVWLSHSCFYRLRQIKVICSSLSIWLMVCYHLVRLL